MDEKERNWLMGQLREADAIGDIERANKIADILRGGGPQPQGPTQEMLREGEVITDPAAEQAQIRAQWREEEPLPLCAKWGRSISRRCRENYVHANRHNR